MISSVFDRMSPFQRSLFSAAVALIAYGVWAYLVNSMHGSFAAAKAACVQGGYSFLLTFVMTILIELLYRASCTITDSDLISKILTIVITCCMIFSASWWVNVLAGTPEIFNTVILGYLVGGVFTAGYVIGLAGERVRKQL
ncbi:MAG: hypothetical protein ACI9WC_000176 [Arenicella sp.]|jgi:hypothetical protein